MKRVGVFVDPDVAISSLISQKGAAYLLLINEFNFSFTISDISKKELEKVAKRLNIKQSRLQDLIKKHLQVSKLKKGISKIKQEFKDYTTDIDDAHIVAGAKSAKTKFLLTYNIRHFQRQRIKENLGIVVLTPAQFLQYLRSID